jgi:hypothetical protein
MRRRLWAHYFKRLTSKSYSVCVPIQNQTIIFPPAAAQGAVILIDANGPDIGKELLEAERGVERLGLPKMKFIPGKSLNGDWKGAKAKPEVLVGF